MYLRTPVNNSSLHIADMMFQSASCLRTATRASAYKVEIKEERQVIERVVLNALESIGL